jgi:hypothetical protein
MVATSSYKDTVKKKNDIQIHTSAYGPIILRKTPITFPKILIPFGFIQNIKLLQYFILSWICYKVCLNEWYKKVRTITSTNLLISKNVQMAEKCKIDA